MKKEDYLQIFNEKPKIISQKIVSLVPWMDNDPKHRSVVKEQQNQARLEILEWPSQSPDLNPIKKIRTVLKEHICAWKLTNLHYSNLHYSKCRDIGIWYVLDMQ